MFSGSAVRRPRGVVGCFSRHVVERFVGAIVVMILIGLFAAGIDVMQSTIGIPSSSSSHASSSSYSRHSHTSFPHSVSEGEKSSDDADFRSPTEESSRNNSSSSGSSGANSGSGPRGIHVIDHLPDDDASRHHRRDNSYTTIRENSHTSDGESVSNTCRSFPSVWAAASNGGDGTASNRKNKDTIHGVIEVGNNVQIVSDWARSTSQCSGSTISDSEHEDAMRNQSLHSGSGRHHKHTPPRPIPRDLFFAERVALCYEQHHARFLFYGNNWGRHSNQMTSLLAALAIARRLGRTLIVPPFFADHKSLRSPMLLPELYDASALLDPRRSPYCLLSEDEFGLLEQRRGLRQRSKKEVGEARDEEERPTKQGSSPPLVVPAACITMRGIPTFPRQPASSAGIRFECAATPPPQQKGQHTMENAAQEQKGGDDNEKATQMSSSSSSTTLFVKYKKRLGLFLSVAGGERARQARVLTVPLVIYYAPKIAAEDVRCLWGLLQPHPVIAAAATRLLAWARRGETTTGHPRTLQEAEEASAKEVRTSPHSPRATMLVGVHVRALEGSCESRVPELERAAAQQENDARDDSDDVQQRKQQQQQRENNKSFLAARKAALLQQCRMEAAYVQRQAHPSQPSPQYGLKEESPQPQRRYEGVHYLIADDNQQPAAVDRLVKALSSSSSLTSASSNDNGNGLLDGGGEVSTAATATTTTTTTKATRLFSLYKQLRIAPPPPASSSSSAECGGSAALSRYPSLFYMQLDFWVLVWADRFVGNQLSTLSTNVCRRRVSTGAACPNFVGTTYLGANGTLA